MAFARYCSQTLFSECSLALACDIFATAGMVRFVLKFTQRLYGKAGKHWGKHERHRREGKKKKVKKRSKSNPET